MSALTHGSPDGSAKPRASQEEATSRPGAGQEQAKSKPGASQEHATSRPEAGLGAGQTTRMSDCIPLKLEQQERVGLLVIRAVPWGLIHDMGKGSNQPECHPARERGSQLGSKASRASLPASEEENQHSRSQPATLRRMPMILSNRSV